MGSRMMNDIFGSEKMGSCVHRYRHYRDATRNSRAAAVVNNQGRKPLEDNATTDRLALKGRQRSARSRHCRRSAAFDPVYLYTRGLRPWLLTCAAPRRNTTAPRL